MQKIHIEPNTVQETLVIPLFGRKLCAEQFPDLFYDKKAIELIDRLDYDVSSLEETAKKSLYRFGALEVAMRENDLAFEVKNYLDDHPDAAVVNLGCGLGQTAEFCDNGRCRIYNLDLPDVIAARDQLLPGTDRIKNIAADLNDVSCFSEIDASRGVIFIAAGVFYYFRRDEIEKLFPQIAEHFRGGRLVFDTAGRKAVKLMLKTWVKQAGIKDVGAFFHVDDLEKDFAFMPKGAKVSARGYMLGYNDLKDPSVSGFFRFLSKVCDGRLSLFFTSAEAAFLSLHSLIIRPELPLLRRPLLCSDRRSPCLHRQRWRSDLL